jgi:hypothetical protein
MPRALLPAECATANAVAAFKKVRRDGATLNSESQKSRSDI